MTSDGLLILQTVFTSIWTLFTDWNIPGTNTNPATWFLFLLCAGIGIRHLKRLLMDTSGEMNSSARKSK